MDTEDGEITESMDDFMAKAFDDLETDQTETDQPDIPDTPDTNDTPAPEEADAEKDTDAKAEEAEAASKPEEDQAIVAPQSMSAKDREAFYALPPESQKWVSDREKAMQSDYTQKTMKLAEDQKRYDRLDQILAPRRQALAMEGMDEGTAVGQLFALSDFANARPVDFIKYFCNARGIPLSQLNESGGDQPAISPEITAMQQKIHGLETQLTKQSETQQTQQQQTVTREIAAFAEDPAYRYYGELEGQMIPLVTAFRQAEPGLPVREYLAKAYNAALANNPDIKARIEADANATRIAEAKKVADKAKKATGVNVRSSASLPAAAKKAKSVDEFIGSLVDERMTG